MQISTSCTLIDRTLK